MPDDPSDPKDEPSDPKDDSYLESWIDRTPEPIESVIPQLQEFVVDVPDTPRPTDEDREEAPSSRMPVFIGVGLLGVMLLALFFAWLSRGSEPQPQPTASESATEIDLDDSISETFEESSTSTSTSSPPADEGATSIHLVGSAGDFTCEDPDNTLDPALDITGVDVVQDGDEIDVTLTFDGDAEAYEEATTEKFPFSFQLRLKEDTAGYPEVFFAEKGVIKVAGGLLQVVSYEFSGNKLIIRLKGRTLEDVHAVQASTFTFDGGRCQDLINSPGYND